MANDLKSDIAFAIERGKKALGVAQKWVDFNAGRIPGNPPVEEGYDLNYAASRFRSAARIVDERIPKGRMPKDVSQLLVEYASIKSRIANTPSLNQGPSKKDKVMFTLHGKDCEAGTSRQFALGDWALKILDVGAKDADGQLLIGKGHFRFKGNTRTFPEESNHPAVKTWKILRALLSTPDRNGVASVRHIPHAASVIERKKNRVEPVETWQDHVQAVDKDGNPVSRGGGKKMYRRTQERVR